MKMGKKQGGESVSSALWARGLRSVVEGVVVTDTCASAFRFERQSLQRAQGPVDKVRSRVVAGFSGSHDVRGEYLVHDGGKLRVINAGERLRRYIGQGIDGRGIVVAIGADPSRRNSYFRTNECRNQRFERHEWVVVLGTEVG